MGKFTPGWMLLSTMTMTKIMMTTMMMMIVTIMTIGVLHVEASDVTCPTPAKNGNPYTFDWTHPWNTDRFQIGYYPRGSTSYQVVTTCYKPSGQHQPQCDAQNGFEGRIQRIQDWGYQITFTIGRVDKLKDATIWVLSYYAGRPDYLRDRSCRLIVYDPCPYPAKEGKRYVMTQTVDMSRHSYFTWQYYQDTSIDPQTISRCRVGSSPPCSDQSNSNTRWSISKTRHIRDFIYNMTLTIHQVLRSRDETIWSWHAGEDQGSADGCFLQVYSPCPNPAKEGQSYSMLQTIELPQQSYLTWQYYEYNSSNLVDHSKCYGYGSSTAPYCWNVTQTNKSTSTIQHIGNTRYRSTLTIHHVTRLMDGALWRWYMNDNSQSANGCFLQVYSFDSKPVCDTLRMTITGTHAGQSAVLYWMCKVSGVYPRPGCQFEYTDQSTTQIVPDVNIDRIITSRNSVFNISCNMTLPVSMPKQATYKFTFIAYPLDIYTSPQVQQSSSSKDITLSTSALECDTPSLVNYDIDLTINCSMYSPYSVISCVLEVSRDNGAFQRINARWEQMTSPCQGSSYPCTNGCSLTVGVKTLGVGQRRFRVVAGVSNNRQTFNPIGISNPSDEIVFSKPIAAIAECPSGYIRQGSTTETCRCYLSHKGNPPGIPVWLFQDGSRVPDQTKGKEDSTLRIQYRNDLTYHCAGVSPLGKGPGNAYTPPFAYGPTSVQMSVENHVQTFSVCPGNNESFVVFCDVDIANSNPAPHVYAQGEGSTVQKTLAGTVIGNVRRHTFLIKPEKWGPLVVKCVAANAIFTDISVDNTRTITIYSPPTSPPSFSLNSGKSLTNGTVVDVFGGSTVMFTCSVPGGYPSTGVGHITCWNQTQSYRQGPNRGTLALNVDKSMNGIICKCYGHHASKCYKQKIFVTLNVRYKPRITTFQANSKLDQLIVNEGTMVTFHCKADGNPKPEIVVKGEGPMEVVEMFTDNQWTTLVHVNKEMTCSDSGMYTCSASNSEGVVDGRQLVVLVKCSPQSSNLTATNLTVTPGFPLELEVPIQGYPPPNSLIITKQESRPSISNLSIGRTRREALTVSGTHGNVDYNVSYLDGGPADGTVVVVMSGFKRADSGQYTLHVKNGEGQGLNHSFTVIVTSGNPPGPPREHDSDNSGDGGNDVLVACVVTGIVFIVIVFIFILVIKRKEIASSLKTVDRKGANQQKQHPEIDDIDIVEIDNEIYGMDNPQTCDYNDEPYAELNESEIVSIRKESAAREIPQPTSHDSNSNAGCDDFPLDKETGAKVNHSTTPCDNDSESENDYVYI